MRRLVLLTILLSLQTLNAFAERRSKITFGKIGVMGVISSANPRMPQMIRSNEVGGKIFFEFCQYKDDPYCTTLGNEEGYLQQGLEEHAKLIYQRYKMQEFLKPTLNIAGPGVVTAAYFSGLGTIPVLVLGSLMGQGINEINTSPEHSEEVLDIASASFQSDFSKNRLPLSADIDFLVFVDIWERLLTEIDRCRVTKRRGRRCKQFK